MSPTYAPIRLSQDVKDALGDTAVNFGKGFHNLTVAGQMLVALTVKAQRTGSPVFAGIPASERARRRAKGRVARRSRQINRAA